jgi:hypothetical protein
MSSIIEAITRSLPLFKNLESICHNNYFEFEFQSSISCSKFFKFFGVLFVWLCFLKFIDVRNLGAY